jgi:hypothetical protein
MAAKAGDRARIGSLTGGPRRGLDKTDASCAFPPDFDHAAVRPRARQRGLLQFQE